MPTENIFYAIALFVSAAITFLLAWFAGRRQKAPGSLYFILLMLSVGEWALSSGMEMLAVPIPDKVFWAKLSYLGVNGVGPLWLLFALEYSQRSSWLIGRRRLLLGILPVIIVTLAFTNDLHKLLWPLITPTTSAPGAILVYSHGAIFWVHAAYVYILLLAGTIILFRSVRRSQTLLRNQAVFLLAGAVVPWVSNFIYLSGLNPFPGLDLTPFAFTITGILIASSIFRYQLFDIMPVAYDALFLHMGSGALVLDTQNRLVDINPVGQSLLEIEASAIGKPLESALSKYPDFYRMITNNGGELNEILLNHRQSPLWIETRATQLKDKLDRTTGKLIVVQDINVRKQAEREIVIAREQAEEANLMKSQLIANVSHDLRTPLGAIIGYADMVRSDVYGATNPGQKQTMVEIIDSANQLLAFVNNLISQAQIETGKLTLNIRKFNPRIDLIDPLKSTFSLMAERKMVDVNFVISPSLPAEIYGDPYWIRQVMMNLVGNAVKFTEEGKVNVMLLQVDESHWAIQVSDTGIGIPSESRRMIFESFRQLDSSLTRKYGGSGLGLSIVKQLIDLMGGRVDLESEVGEGSTFTVVIPYQTVPETN